MWRNKQHDGKYNSTLLSLLLFTKGSSLLFSRSFFIMPAKAAQTKKQDKKPAEGSSGGKAKKKKWSKGKVRDKLNNMVSFVFFWISIEKF